MRISSKHLLILLFVPSCSSHQSKHSDLPETTFVNLYADMLVLQEGGKISGIDSVAMSRKIDSLYGKYGTTREVVETTTDNLQSNLQKWKQFYDKVVKRLEQLQQAEGSKIKS